ncbi:cactin-like protein [Aureococcus anophagefferens]|uniref:Splicing factor Cactin n=1 Tax=Aureococcus anophagefferens TaxID=44056 RepID=A0ABR1FSM5_AURAN
MSDRDHRERKKDKKKEKKKKHKKEKLHEVVGYSNDDNPFGDSNLGAKFTWKKKEDLAKKEKRRDRAEDAARDAHFVEEIEKVRKRRAEREHELAEMERLRDEEQRLRDAEQFGDWQAKEEAFHLEQTRIRSLLRLVGGRSRPVDVVAKNLLMIEQGENEMRGETAARARPGGVTYGSRDHADLSGLECELRPAYATLDGLDARGLAELGADAREYAEREGELGEWRPFWDALLVLVDAAPGGDASGWARGRRPATVAALLRGKDKAALGDMGDDAEARAAAARDAGDDDAYWRGRQLKVLEFRKARAAADPEAAAARDAAASGAATTTARHRSPDDAAGALLDKEEAQGRRRGRGRHGRVVGGRRGHAPARLGGPHEPRKPRYLNRIKTGYEWNLYNRAHYSSGAAAEGRPGLQVQHLPGPRRRPRCPSSSSSPAPRATSSSSSASRLGALRGPRLQIVNRAESQPKRGFRCVFERGILQLHFNFKRWRYRRC